MSEGGSGQYSHGIECLDCGRIHTDWTEDGEYAVRDEHNVGIMHRFECGHCGSITEVPTR